MKSVIGLGLGAAFATIVACAASPPAAKAPAVTAAEPPPGAGGMPQTATRDDIDRLDALITEEMAKLGEQRPAPPPTACVSNCAQQMSGAAVAATAPDAECKTGKGQKCTDACTLKDSICKSAGKICEIAGQLGGNDAYANDKCNNGSASCDAAKKRCCSCV